MACPLRRPKPPRPKRRRTPIRRDLNWSRISDAWDNNQKPSYTILGYTRYWDIYIVLLLYYIKLSLFLSLLLLYYYYHHYYYCYYYYISFVLYNSLVFVKLIFVGISDPSWSNDDMTILFGMFGDDGDPEPCEQLAVRFSWIYDVRFSILNPYAL